ncbi:thiosulfate sulfurtransferase PspE precursor [Oxobacter pfennigii]|uniref:Thiosulfate sulfurtransferase PspE n=1 Tax=Oxobacter pfennigii TaxID=36849 RepID=A0A0P8WC64_9CLOT|nr:rhodanese-like domain-containing protein [Oxobacter pfennigii]KPU45321.1 thiosulfate sulfurtransferase PspE precursor [Oxobacter pfennigii]
MSSKRHCKLLSVVLTLTVFLGILAGCTSNNQPSNSQPTKATEPTKAAEPTKTDVVADAANAYFANMGSDTYKIPEKDFVAKVKANEPMFILDIRQADVYEKGHIKGAVNLPWGTAISDNLTKLPKDKPIMVYCYTGQTAGQTVALLNVAGFDAKSVNLGWDLGISKVEGVADVTETTANPLTDITTEVNPEIKAAIDKYYKGLTEITDARYKNYKISEDDAKKLVDDKDTSVIFLSVRKAEDYANGHIEGAVNIPFAKGMQQKFNTLPKDKKIIVYCYTGQTAGQTVAILRLLGYDAVSLNAGMGMPSNAPAGWLNKGYPVVKSEEQKPVESNDKDNS